MVTCPLVRCIGVDGRVGPVLLAAQAALPGAGDTSLAGKLCFEASDLGRGWFLDHYNHMHVSTWP